MARVLISFLGTGSKTSGEYQKTNYHFDDSDKDFPYSFVAAAIYEKYRVDKIFLLGTTHSMWGEVYYYFGKQNNEFDEDIWTKITDYCEKANHESELVIPHADRIEAALGKGSKVIPIRYGINSDEIRENSDIILRLEEELSPRDELIIDITHSFRSLPMYVMNLLIYLRNVSNKRIDITHICYGMLEITRELTPPHTPIIEMKELLTVNDWISGAYSFVEFGNAYKIAELVESVDKSLSTRLKVFSDAKNLNHLTAIERQCQQLQAIRKNEGRSRIVQMAITPIVERFLDRMEKGRSTRYPHSEFQYRLSCWQNDNRNYAAAYISLTEAIVTRACEEIEKENPFSLETRNEIKNDFKKITSDKENYTVLQPWRTFYWQVSKRRNALAHSMSENTDSMQAMIRDLAGYLKKYHDLTC